MCQNADVYLYRFATPARRSRAALFAGNLSEWGPGECGAKTACFLRFSDADDGEGGGFKRRHLYQSGKGVSFFLTKPHPKRVNGVFVRWTQELAGFC